jgi:hypothetical protein
VTYSGKRKSTRLLNVQHFHILANNFSIMKSPRPYSAGRIVMYVLSPLHQLYNIGNNTSPLPAIIVNAWEGNEIYQGEGKVNLKVFTDGPTDEWATSVPYSEEKTPGTWHWPEIK